MFGEKMWIKAAKKDTDAVDQRYDPSQPIVIEDYRQCENILTWYKDSNCQQEDPEANKNQLGWVKDGNSRIQSSKCYALSFTPDYSVRGVCKSKTTVEWNFYNIADTKCEN